MTANVQRLQRPVHLVLDFDATLTVCDTIILLREVPIQRDKRLGHNVYPIPEWSSLEHAYMEDYNIHEEIEDQAQKRAERRTLPFTDQARDYSQKLAGRRVVEEQSMRRLEGWNFFRGATRADVCKAAETVLEDRRLEMRDHWSDLMKVVSSKDSKPEVIQKSKVSIISLNWSKTFIKQCLLGALRHQHENSSELKRFINQDLQIQSCEIVGLDETEGSSGKMQADVLSSADKLKYLPTASLRSSSLYRDRRPDPAAPRLVYVGDSATDLDCLMAADTGIWFSPAKDLDEANRKCEETFKPLKLNVRFIEEVNQGHVAEGELVWAQNFEQITQYLCKLAP